MVDFEDAEAPRGNSGSREPTPLGRFVDEVRLLRAAVEELQRGSQLRNASISGGRGLRILDEDGNVQAQISPDRTITVFDESSEPVLRMGQMQESGPEPYGIEVRIGQEWIQLGSQNVAWSNVGAKPGWAANPDSISGGNISGPVARALQADATAQADGVTPAAFERVVAGVPGAWQAMYMHSNGQIGRGSSSLRYKKNVHPVGGDPLRALQYRPVTYDRKANGADDYTPAVSTNEQGLIAEEVEQINPALATYHNGQVDGVRYELLALEMIPALQNQEQRLQVLEEEQDRQAALILELQQRLEGTTA